jgi:hypothetical protein
VGLVSALIVLAAAVYVMSPSQQALALSLNSQFSSSLKGEVIHGWVHASNGNPIVGAVVRLYHGSVVEKTVQTSSTGHYSMSLNLAKGSYKISFHCDHVKAGTRTFTLAPKHRYDINAQAKSKALIVLPIFNY